MSNKIPAVLYCTENYLGGSLNSDKHFKSISR